VVDHHALEFGLVVLDLLKSRKRFHVVAATGFFWMALLLSKKSNSFWPAAMMSPPFWTVSLMTWNAAFAAASSTNIGPHHDFDAPDD
jgi:hypothetical protein